MAATTTMGERIRRARRDAGLSQDELAQKMGVTKCCISKYEQGRVTSSIRAIEKIAACCGCSPTYLAGWADVDKLTAAHSRL